MDLTGPLVRGIDVASPQGLVSWPKVARWVGPDGERIEFAIVKATQGNTITDPFFVPNWNGVAAVGLLRGAYHFADPDPASSLHPDDAGDEASRFVALLHEQGFRPGVDFAMLDIEEARKIHAGPEFGRWVATWKRVARDGLGQRSITYTGGPFWMTETAGVDVATMVELLADPFLVAAYVRGASLETYVPQGAHLFGWQRTGDQAASDSTVLHLDGIGDGKTTDVDRDLYFGSIDDMRTAIASLVVARTPTTIPAPGPEAHPDGASAFGLQLARQAEIADESLSTTLPEKSSQRLAAVDAPIIDNGPPTPRGSGETT